MSASVHDPERLMQIILAPVITEKATYVGGQSNQKVFVVAPNATKPEVKAAVEDLFKVKVKSVQIANIKGKSKRFGRTFGRRSDLRKAFVRLQAGQEISFTEGRV